MIIEGLKLMIVGMTTVMMFLTLMILLIGLAARLTKGVTARELQAIEDERKRVKQEREREKLAAAAGGGDEDIVVISAAIAAFEAQKAAA